MTYNDFYTCLHISICFIGFTKVDTVFIVLNVMTGLVDTFYFRSIYLNLTTMGCRKGDDTSTPNAGAILNLSRRPQ